MDNILHPRQSSRRRRQQRQENRQREERGQPPSYQESQRQPSYEESMNSTRPGGVWGTYATPRNDDLHPISYDSHMQRQRRHELSLQQQGVPQHPQMNVGNPMQLPWAPQPTQPTSIAQPMSPPRPGLSDNEIARGGQALSEMRQRREQHEQQQRERQEHERRLQEQNVPQVPPMPPMPALQLPPSMQPQPRPPGSGGQRRR